MTEKIIKPKDKFSFTRLRRGPSESAQLLENFDGVPPPNDDVLFYRLLCSPSDDPPAGRDRDDRFEALGVGYPTRLNEIVADVLEMSRQPSETTPAEPTPTKESVTATKESVTARKEWTQYLNVMYIAFGPYVFRAAD